jgi:hypothetical protein
VIGFAALVVILLFFYLRYRKKQLTIQKLAMHPAPARPSTTNLTFIGADASAIQQQIQQNPHLITNGLPMNRLAIEGTQAQYLGQGGVLYDGSTVAIS